MRRQQFLRCALGALAALAGPAARAAASAEPLHWDTRSLVGFGTTLSLQAAHADPARLHEALDAAVALLQRLHGQMNLFDPDSALSRLNRQGRLARPPAELLGLLRRAQAISARSGGSFDVTVQPLWALYDRCRQPGACPPRPSVRPRGRRWAGRACSWARTRSAWRGRAWASRSTALPRAMRPT
jgi:thiamine biosynthesis lipoprotein